MTATDGQTNSPFKVNALSNERFGIAVDMMSKFNVDFAINLGDMVHPLPDSEDYNKAAERYFQISEGLGHKHYCIPGNHDIGDKPSKWVPAEEISSQSISKYQSYFGTDFQSFNHKGWQFILLNAELFNSDLENNNFQKKWLENELKSFPVGRTIVSIHYPPFLYSSDETDHYDNLSPNDRDWLLKNFCKYKVPLVLSGHVHNFWYNSFKSTDLLIIPSTSFVRQDYAEMYASPSPLEGGRDDINKLGFFLIKIDGDEIVWKFYRTFGGENAMQRQSPVAHCPKDKRNVSFGADMRLPWITNHEIPPSGALDEFYRKTVRNDYTFLALYELGINRLRLPFNDLFQADVCKRLTQIKKFGFEYTFYSLDNTLPYLTDAPETFAELIDCLEIVSPINKLTEVEPQIAKIKSKYACPILLSPLWQKFGETDDLGRHLHIIKHGFPINEFDKAKDFFTKKSEFKSLKHSFDGVVCELDLLNTEKYTWDNINSWETINEGRLHILVSCKSSNPADQFTDEELLTEKLLKLWHNAKLSPNKVTFFIDSFTEIDRGYFRRAGIINRLGNPMKAWHDLMRT